MTSDPDLDFPVLVVIPCLNEVHHLDNVVSGLMLRKVPLLTVVIVDGGSTDGTVNVAKKLSARYPDVKLLANPRRVQSAGINLAVENFGKQSKFLIRMDAHAEYPVNFCETLIKEAERTGASSVVVAMNTIGTAWFQRIVAIAQNSKIGNGGAAHRNVANEGTWTDHGHHALMRIDAFLGVGGYDENFSHNEDFELDIRLRESGFKIWITGKAAINYYPRSSPSSLFRQYINFGSGRASTMFKHRYTPKVRQLLPAAVVPACVLAAASPVVWVAAMPFAMWSVLCIAYGLHIGLKERNLSAAFAGPIAMIMHLGWSLGFWRVVLRKLYGSAVTIAAPP